MSGVILVIIAAISRIAGFERAGLVIFVASWFVLVIHLSLSVNANFRHNKFICLREFGRLGVISAIIMKMLELPFVFPVMIFAGLMYAGGYFGARKEHEY
jgi:hypothetical protein